MDPDSGEYNAQGIELDVDNMNAHRGDDSGASGLAQPNTYGFAVGVSTVYHCISKKKSLLCKFFFQLKLVGGGGITHIKVTGAGSYRSTAAIAVMGADQMWNRGIVGCANDAVVQVYTATFT
jgi:hypothetical protein